MSCRSFSQLSFAQAFATGHARGGGFLEEIDKALDWSAFEVLLARIKPITLASDGRGR